MPAAREAADHPGIGASVPVRQLVGAQSPRRKLSDVLKARRDRQDLGPASSTAQGLSRESQDVVSTALTMQ